MDALTGDVGYLSKCAGKEAFELRKYAEKAAKRRKGRLVYRCDCCHQYHVGTTQPKHFKKIYRNNGKRKNHG